MTEMKNSLKLIIALVVAIFVVCIFNTSTVNAATEIDESNIQEILDMLPESMDVDVSEIDYKQALEIIETKAKSIWESKNISFNNVKLEADIFDYFEVEKFHEAYIGFYSNDNKELGSKTISISYNNTKNWNEEDSKYCKSLEFKSPKYYVIDINEFEKVSLFDCAIKYYTTQLNDETIKILATEGAGDGGPLGQNTHSTILMIFKNDVLYDIKGVGAESTIPLINIPYNIPDSEVIQYATDALNNYFKKLDIPETTVKELIKGDYLPNISDEYKVLTTSIGYDGVDEGCVIIRKDKKVTSTDTTTNIKLEADTALIPEDTKLVVEKVTDGTNYNVVVKALGEDVDKFTAYNISLQSNNVTIQPNGKVKISLPIPEGYDTSKLVIYRIAEDGTKTKYDITIKDGYAIFETDHFSNYVLAEESKKQETNTTIDNTTNNTTDNTSNSDNSELDVTPKTGENNIATIISSMLSVLSIAGLAIIKKV